MSEPQLHPEHQDIVDAAKMHATYYRQLVWEHGIHPDNATELTRCFIELAYEREETD